MGQFFRSIPWSVLGILAVLCSAGWGLYFYSNRQPESPDFKTTFVIPVENTSRTAEQREVVSAGMDKIRGYVAQEQTYGIFRAIPIYKLRSKLSEELLEIPLTSAERQFVLISLLDSLMRLTETRDLYSREKLVRFAGELLNDADPLVRRQALISDSSRRVVDFVRVEEYDPSFAKNSLLKLLRQFPNDYDVLSFNQSICGQLIQENQIGLATEMMLAFEDHYQASDDPRFKDFANRIPDLIRMAQVRFDVAIQEMYMSDPDFEKFFRIAQDLSKGPIGNELLRQMISAALRCERMGRFKEATVLYQHLGERVSSDLVKVVPDEIRADSEKTISAGLRRIQSIGSPVVLVGMTRDGRPVNLDSVKGSPTLVVFWSTGVMNRNPDYLPALDQCLKSLQAKKVKVLGYCTDQFDEEAIRKKIGVCPDWVVTVNDKETRNLVELLGVPSAPYILLLDAESKISSINLDPNELGPAMAKVGVNLGRF